MTRVINYRLEVASKEKQKMKKIVERQKTEAMVAKHWKVRRGISLSNEEEKSYESDTGDEIDSNQVNDEYLLQF